MLDSLDVAAHLHNTFGQKHRRRYGVQGISAAWTRPVLEMTIP
jgi:hypothetical protein